MTTNEVEPQETQLKETKRQRLREWFKTQAGDALFNVEKSQLEEELPLLFGYHILQLGALSDSPLLESSRISHQILFDLYPQDIIQDGHLVCRSTHLPIDENCVDVALLPHVLEYESDPHDILREIERVLIGEGHLIIIGFNPLSLWGIWRILLAWREKPPWSGHFYSAARVKDWLGLLGFEVVKTKYMFFRPPVQTSWIMKRLSFLEKLGNYLFPWFGGTYMIIGKKRLIPITPTKVEWRIRRRLIASGITEPTARTTKTQSRST
ncbi:MAG: methyltransferase domain-containing protein [Gammaproteobacteria bacterium]